MELYYNYENIFFLLFEKLVFEKDSIFKKH